MRLFLLLFIAFPILELWVLIAVGSEIGALATIGLLFLMAALGLVLLRLQGIRTLFRGRARLARGELPAREMVDGMMLAFCGVLLILPGFISDAIALVCLLPGVRHLLIAGLLRRGWVAGKHNAFTFYSHRRSGPGRHRADDSIDAEYWREDERRKSLDRDQNP